MAILAARVMSRRGGAADGAADGAAPRQGVRYRRAGPADIDTVVRLGLEVVRYDAHFGNGGERTGTVEALRVATVGLLGEPGPWTWLAERDGRPVGMVCAQRPHAAGWITPLVRQAPAAYLMLMFVQPGERGAGVGAELVARLHRDIDAAGVAVTLLHYQTLNPLSAPFWNQQGYRPLWTSWEARPARVVR
jgi:GNAT superfamily N-acetyltransferase